MWFKNHCRNRMKGYKYGHWTLEIIDLGTFFLEKSLSQVFGRIKLHKKII